MANQITHNETTFHVGDRVTVNYRLIEKEVVAGKAKREKKEEVRERIQGFEGIVIKIRGEGDNRSFTVRRIASGQIGVERIFPLVSPWIKSINVLKEAKVRRAKLYYLRDKIGKEAQSLKEKEEIKAKAKKATIKVKKTPRKRSSRTSK